MPIIEPFAQELASDYDYVIVGAGSAGCVVARRLLERTDATVLLLEAGGDDAGVGTIQDPGRWVENVRGPRDHGYSYAPNPHLYDRVLPLPRGRVLGGSGSINAMVWSRGHRADFDGWAAAGNRGWGFESVLPRFMRSEDWVDGAGPYHGAGGPVHVERTADLHPVAQALIDAGVASGMPYMDDLNVPEPFGAGPMSLNVRRGRRVGPADAYLRPVADNTRLTVVTSAQVTNLRLEPERCVGVDALIGGRPRSIGADCEVILCAGAIDSPRLLMLSGIGPAKELRSLGIEVEADLPGVGKNLQDHPMCAALVFEARRPLAPFKDNLAGSVALCRSRGGLEVPDLMFTAIQIPYVSTEVAGREELGPNLFSIAPALMRPESRGRIRLTGNLPSSPLRIDSAMLSAPRDLHAFATGIEIGLELAAQPAFAGLIARPVAPAKPLSPREVVAFARRSCVSHYHPVGTCAMGSGEQAVVDDRLRVRGVDGLRVADASIMPTITSAYTQAPAVLIGEMVADFVAPAAGKAGARVGATV